MEECDICLTKIKNEIKINMNYRKNINIFQI